MTSDNSVDLSLPTLADPSAPSSWRDHAACQKEGNFIFFASSEKEQAIGICRSCSVKDDCLNFAISNKMKDGVWGGRYFGRKK
jgi:hypothetical protein